MGSSHCVKKKGGRGREVNDGPIASEHQFISTLCIESLTIVVLSLDLDHQAGTLILLRQKQKWGQVIASKKGGEVNDRPSIQSINS